MVWKRGIKPVIARRQTGHGSGLGRHRWVVERTFAWLHNRRRLLIRTDRRDDIHEGFLALACCLICWQHLDCALRQAAGPCCQTPITFPAGSRKVATRRSPSGYGGVTTSPPWATTFSSVSSTRSTKT
jgi:Transposase DDE domain